MWLIVPLLLIQTENNTNVQLVNGLQNQVTHVSNEKLPSNKKKQLLIQTGSKQEKGVHQGCILSPCVFNLYAEYIMRNAGLEEAQAGIKTAGRNINNLRYADDTTLMAEN